MSDFSRGPHRFERLEFTIQGEGQVQEVLWLRVALGPGFVFPSSSYENRLGSDGCPAPLQVPPTEPRLSLPIDAELLSTPHRRALSV